MDDIRSPKNKRDYVKCKDTRLHWSPELHQAFLSAIDRIGGLTKATPKLIVHVMNVEGVTISHVKSHLQMYRGSLKKDNQRKERMKRSNKNNGGGSDQHHDDSLLSANPTNRSQTRRPQCTHALRRASNGLPIEHTGGLMGGGISMQRSDLMETAPQLKSPVTEVEPNIGKENKTDGRHCTPSSIQTPEVTEQVNELNSCSLSLSLSLPEQSNILASSSLRNSNVHDKSNSGVNLDLSISM